MRFLNPVEEPSNIILFGSNAETNIDASPAPKKRKAEEPTQQELEVDAQPPAKKQKNFWKKFLSIRVERTATNLPEGVKHQFRCLLDRGSLCPSIKTKHIADAKSEFNEAFGIAVESYLAEITAGISDIDHLKKYILRKILQKKQDFNILETMTYGSNQSAENKPLMDWRVEIYGKHKDELEKYKTDQLQKMQPFLDKPIAPKDHDQQPENSKRKIKAKTLNQSGGVLKNLQSSLIRQASKKPQFQKQSTLKLKLRPTDAAPNTNNNSSSEKMDLSTNEENSHEYKPQPLKQSIDSLMPKRLKSHQKKKKRKPKKINFLSEQINDDETILSNSIERRITWFIDSGYLSPDRKETIIQDAYLINETYAQAVRDYLDRKTANLSDIDHFKNYIRHRLEKYNKDFDISETLEYTRKIKEKDLFEWRDKIYSQHKDELEAYKTALLQKMPLVEKIPAPKDHCHPPQKASRETKPTKSFQALGFNGNYSQISPAFFPAQRVKPKKSRRVPMSTSSSSHSDTSKYQTLIDKLPETLPEHQDELKQQTPQGLAAELADASPTKHMSLDTKSSQSAVAEKKLNNNSSSTSVDMDFSSDVKAESQINVSEGLEMMKPETVLFQMATQTHELSRNPATLMSAPRGFSLNPEKTESHMDLEPDDSLLLTLANAVSN